MKRLASIPFFLLSALCLWNSLSDFWAAYRTRVVQASVVASKLKIDWGKSESDSYEEPLYTLSVDLKADDSSGRTFSWEGDPGRAVYPEEALDEFKLWSIGTRHSVGILRGNAREIRLDQMETNPEIGKGIAWLFGVFFLGMTAFALLVAGGFDRSDPPTRFAFLKGFGAWTVFFAFGLAPLLGALAFAWGGGRMALTLQPVVAHRVGANAAFDPSNLPPRVEITPKALAELPKHPYDRIEFPWKGQTLHGGLGPWRGTYDSSTVASGDEHRFLSSPENRWDIRAKFSWGEDFGVPFGIMLFFGVAFTGSSLIIRASEQKS